jgi:hypothetical protein
MKDSFSKMAAHLTTHGWKDTTYKGAAVSRYTRSGLTAYLFRADLLLSGIPEFEVTRDYKVYRRGTTFAELVVAIYEMGAAE